MSNLSPAAKRVVLEQGVNLMVRIGALTLPGIRSKQGVKVEWKSNRKKK